MNSFISRVAVCFALLTFFQREGAEEQVFFPGRCGGASPVNTFEQRIACGERVPLSQVSLDELEMLPGIGHTRAQALLEGKEGLLLPSLATAGKKEEEKLRSVQGIGGVTAKKVARFIELR